MLDLIHWHSLNASPLDERSVIIDLGANHGAFARTMHDRFGSHVIAVEPNPELFRQLRELPYVTAFNAAVAAQDGTAHFEVDDNDLASRLGAASARSIEVETISLVSLMERAHVDTIDLLKIDVEGAEIELLMTAPDSLLQSIRQITVELHDFCGFVSAADVARVISRMESLGFYVARMSRVGHQDTWMGNARFCSVGRVDRAHIAALKYGRGARRVFRKATRGSKWHVGMQ